MKQRAKTLKPGDKVSWSTSRGTTTGTVRKKLTKPGKIKSHTISASEEDPQYLVTSNKTGKPAAHKPGSSRKSAK